MPGLFDDLIPASPQAGMFDDLIPKQKTEPRGVVDQLTGQTGERYQTWPERLVRGIGGEISNLVTAPGKAYRGEIEPGGPEAIRAGVTAALAPGLMSPMSPGARLGSKYGAPSIPREPSSGQTAAVTAAELGAPLPVGVASESRGVQAVTQAARQLPFVGQKIEEGAAATIGRAGEAVGDLASSMGASDRATVGANLRTSLDDVISSNKQTIDQSYNSVRSLIDPKATFVPETTKRVFEAITARRTEAGQPNPSSGLEQIENIVTKGVNFDGLIRAKSDLAQTVDFMAQHAGFSTGDKKQLGAALSHDLGEIATKATQPGVNPQSSLSALRQAEGEASKLIESNKTVGKLLFNKRDEGLAGTLLNAASAKNGNLRMIAQLKSQLPKEDFEQVAGTALAELGQNPATGNFSLNKFYTNWEKMSPAARGVMFEKNHGKFLEDIAQLGKHLKDSEQYVNTSGTGRAVALAGLIGTTGSAVVAAAMGIYAPIIGLGASVGGGYLLAQGLARPAVAASMARVARAALAYEKEPTVTKKTTLMLASRDATNNLASVSNVSPNEFLRLLQSTPRVPAAGDGPVNAPAQNEQP